MVHTNQIKSPMECSQEINSTKEKTRQQKKNPYLIKDTTNAKAVKLKKAPRNAIYIYIYIYSSNIPSLNE